MSSTTAQDARRELITEKVRRARDYAVREGFPLFTVCLPPEDADLIAAALRAEPARGAEEMRERAVAACEAEIVRLTGWGQRGHMRRIWPDHLQEHHPPHPRPSPHPGDTGGERWLKTRLMSGGALHCGFSCHSCTKRRAGEMLVPDEDKEGEHLDAEQICLGVALALGCGPGELDGTRCLEGPG